MGLRELFNWRRHSPERLEEVINVVFPERQRLFAVSFYSKWYREDFLNVQLGDGNDMLSKKAFLRSAWFFFTWPPIDYGALWIIGQHAEDELATVVLSKESGRIHYSVAPDDSELIELASNLESFVADLKKAGWSGA